MSEMDIAADRSGAEYAPTGQLLIAEADGAEAAALHAALAGAGVQAPIRMIGEAVRGPQTAGLGPGVTVLSVFVGSRIDRAVLDACPDLRLIATRSTGYDHIDLGACAERGVAVANVPTYGENTVAEHTFALILSLSRNVHKAWVRTQRGDFGLGGLQGFDLRGKTLGIVGLGHIGLHVAKIGRGFGMRVLAFDPAPRSILAEILGFDYAGLDELVAEADIISLHAPYSPATHHLVDRALLGACSRWSATRASYGRWSPTSCWPAARTSWSPRTWRSTPPRRSSASSTPRRPTSPPSSPATRATSSAGPPASPAAPPEADAAGRRPPSVGYVVARDDAVPNPPPRDPPPASSGVIPAATSASRATTPISRPSSSTTGRRWIPALVITVSA
jgi:hypothetical protein